MGKVKAMHQEYGTIKKWKDTKPPAGIPIKHYIGIDPGRKGGMCVVRSDGIPMEWIRMPAPPQIIDWLTLVSSKYFNPVMVTEKSQAMPKQGIVGAFRYGAHFGIFATVAIMLQIPYHEIRPQIWKKALGLSQNKMDSITACRRIFPTVELIPAGCRKEHDGIAEALLIAEWARQKNL